MMKTWFKQYSRSQRNVNFAFTFKTVTRKSVFILFQAMYFHSTMKHIISVEVCPV